MYRLVQTFGNYLIASFRGPWIPFHLAAIVLTYAILMTGSDWAFFEATRASTYHWLVFGAGLGGFVIPILAPVALYVWARLRSDTSLLATSFLLAQAEASAWLISSTYKAFTGRTQPEFLTTFNTLDISHGFHFGFWQNGIFWGWPSSHACVAVAGAIILAYAFSRYRAVVYGTYLYAAFVAVGAAIGFHWLSDAIAGVLIGYAVGASIWYTANTES